MTLLSERLLTLILFTPLLGVLAVMLVPGDLKKGIRWTALISSLVPLGLSILLWFNYQFNLRSALPGFPSVSMGSMAHFGLRIKMVKLLLSILLDMWKCWKSFG